MKRTPKFEPLAIVGMSCLFPKAQSLQDYWANIKEKVDCISEVPETSWKAEDYYNPDKKCPDHVYTKNGGFLNPVDFNPAEWGIAPTDLDSIDTSQLLSLVVAKGALADAGYANKDFDRDNTSVILGLTGTLELVVPLGARLGHPYWKKAMIHAGIDEKIANEVMDSIGKCYVGWQENSFPGLLGNCAAGRIANRLDLHGTNCVVDAACGSSLAALNMAAMELWTGKADMAITGGIDTFNDIFMFMCFCKTPALSPTGHARPFSADNDGTILGEGIGMVVIKRLSDAERDGDRIYACINAVGTSSDGKGKAVYAPSVPGQVKALKRAYEESGIDPKDIGMIEAHGTGTGAGDRVEVEALKEVYGVSETNRPWCALGSVKSQIGHTKAAAGSANIIKAAMALYNKVIPPTIKVSQPADSLKDDNLPFYLPNQIRPWVSDEGKTRHAALSSMGFGGSNYHVILTEYKSEKAVYDWERNVELITLSGSNASEIKTKLQGLKSAKEIRRFAAEARKAFKNTDKARLGFVIDSSTDIEKIVTDISSKLDTCDNKDFTLPNGAAFSTLTETGKIGVLFPGQGSQYPDMALNLMCTSPEAFNALVEADKEIGKLDEAGNHLVDFIYPRPTYNEEKDEQNPEKLKATDIAQPSLGAVSIGMYNTLKDFGLEAAGFAGHSYGELVSLCAAGLFDSKALALISRKRGQLMGQGTGDRGGMIAVIAAREDVEKVMEEEKLDLVVANHNSNKQVVLSGKTSEIERAKDIFKAKKLRATVLNVAGAFHSKFVADAAKPFYEYLKEFKFGKMKYPVYANTTAEKYPTDKEEARKLLGNQLANQVRFVEIIKKMYDDGIRTFIEVGPGAVLSGLIKNILETNDYKVVTMDSSKGKNSSVVDLGKALAQLAAFGYKLDIEKWQNGAEWLEKNPISNKPKMNIPLVGANYKSKALLEHRAEIEKPPVRKLVDEKDVKVVTKVIAADPQKPLQSAIAGRTDTNNAHFVSSPLSQPSAASSPINNGGASPLVPQFNNTTIETLAALQIMQQETAELHKRFLEGQEMAQRALLAAIGGQPMPPMPPIGMPPVPPMPPMSPMGKPPVPPMPPIPPMPMPPLGVHGVPPIPPMPPIPVAGPTFYQSNVPPAPTSTGSAPTKVGEVARSAERGLHSSDSQRPPQSLRDSSPIINGGASSVDADKLRDTLIDVVAEKTGYPKEMLNLDMDMEAELGIDSIKRVEIMSAIQERLPDAPVVQPDQLGKLRTLNQILEVISPKSSANAHSVSSPLSQPSAASSATRSHPVARLHADIPVGSPASGVASSVSADKLRETLIDVVAEKTGYPKEMLNLDMDMEAELGIDSIKRVEIMSAIQERLPDAPVVQPDQLGKLRTLNQILEVITPASSSNAHYVSSPLSQPSAASSPINNGGASSVNADKLKSTLIEVVSEKTGYPADMLNLDMDMEAELGIDSIKRVEIMSAIQERLPDAPVVQPDQLGKLRTLNQILEVISPVSSSNAHSVSSPLSQPSAASSPASGVASSVSADKLKSTLIEVVSEKTGYPQDMLNLDMDMEAELGIDSIKRVEIMSAIQERLPDAPVVQPDQLGKPRTLNQILEVITPKTDANAHSVSSPLCQPSAASSPSSFSNSGGAFSVNADKLRETLIDVVSEKTGYPSDMLNLDMDMEAELGIDSIKRVEIMSAIQERLPEAPVVQPDQLGKLRTLNQILEVITPQNTAGLPRLSTRNDGNTETTNTITTTTTIKTESSLEDEDSNSAEDFELKRTIIKAVEIGKPDGIKLLKKGDKVVISNDDAELAESLAKKLLDNGFKAETQSLAEIMAGKFPKDAKGLVVIAPKPEKAALNLWEDSSVEWLKEAFMAIKEAGSALKANKGVLATVSRLDGSFGLASMTKNVDPVQGGLAGISKTTRYEWSEVTSKAIDLDYRLKENDAAAELLAEEITISGPMETGLSKTSRKKIEEIEEARSEKADAPATFQNGDTIIVTGGARGVTAETAIAFAKQYGTNMVLLGRSALPEAEPAWLASLKNEAEIKRAIMQNSNKKMTPKELGAAYKTAMANREVLTNIARLQKLGVKVKYYSASVLDEEQVAKIVAEARSEFGNISGIIHGAGVKRDKNIEDKTREQLDDVINTKVKGLKNLLKATIEDNLKAIVLFSSFSGRQGRTGQVDYAMANEVLNKVAQKVKVLRNDCHVMAFNWGPWDGGMVDSSLRKVFINEGIGLIPLKKGARCPIVELTNDNEGAVEIGIIGLIDGKEALSSSKKA